VNDLGLVWLRPRGTCVHLRGIDLHLVRADHCWDD
jgi:hypothetical protein